MFRRQKQIILRTIVMILCLTGVVFMIGSDTSNPSPEFRYTEQPAQGFLYGTHLSILGADTGIILAGIGIVLKVEKINKFVHNQFVKNAVFTFIIITGFVFTTVAYIPLIIFTNTGPGFKLVMVSTTFKHEIIPGAFLILAIFDGECNKSKINLGYFRKALVMFILPVLGITYAFIVSDIFPNIDPPYITLNYDPEAGIGYPLSDPGIIALFNVSTVMCVAIAYVIVSTFVFGLADRNFKKNELTTEIVDELLLKEIYKK